MSLDLDPIRARWATASGFVTDATVSAPQRLYAFTAAAYDVPLLLTEVDRLRAELHDEQAVQAKTVDNFESFVESMTEERNTITDERDRLRREVEGLRAWRDGNHDELRKMWAEVERLRAELAARPACECLDCANGATR